MLKKKRKMEQQTNTKTQFRTNFSSFVVKRKTVTHDYCIKKVFDIAIAIAIDIWFEYSISSSILRFYSDNNNTIILHYNICICFISHFGLLLYQFRIDRMWRRSIFPHNINDLFVHDTEFHSLNAKVCCFCFVLPHNYEIISNRIHLYFFFSYSI